MRRLYLAMCLALAIVGTTLVALPAAATTPPPEYITLANGVTGELVGYDTNCDGSYTAEYAPISGGPHFIIIWGS